MQDQNRLRSTRFSFPISKCAIALLCCAFSVEPLFAQEVDWPYYGNDQGNMRYQNIDQINLTNVSQLKPAWTFHTGYLSDPNMSMEMTPIVLDGMMFVTTGDDDVFALNPTTGKQIWHYHPSDMPAPSLGRSPVLVNGLRPPTGRRQRNHEQEC